MGHNVFWDEQIPSATINGKQRERDIWVRNKDLGVSYADKVVTRMTAQQKRTHWAREKKRGGGHITVKDWTVLIFKGQEDKRTRIRAVVSQKTGNKFLKRG